MFREGFGSFWWAVGCLGMAEYSRSGPDETVERPAIRLARVAGNSLEGIPAVGAAHRPS